MKTRVATKVASFRISPSIEAQLKRIALRQERTFGQLVRKALTEYLAKHNGNKVA